MTKTDLIHKLEENGYTEVSVTEYGFTAKNHFGEFRKFRLDIAGNDKVPFYNIVAIDVSINSDDMVKPIEIRQFVKDFDGNYLYAITIMDLTINKTTQEIRKLERLAQC